MLVARRLTRWHHFRSKSHIALGEPDPGENLEPTCLRDARVAASAGGRVYAPLPGKKR
jgi:hypothetical protein